MLKIGKPYLKQQGERVRICAKLVFSVGEKELWYEVDKKYEQYLTLDRSDAFVVSVLSAAMRVGEDIICEAPITKRLAYQLNCYLIPALAQNTKRYHKIKVVGEYAEELRTTPSAVGIGWTGGIDCFYTYMKHSKESASDYKISHLVVANIGTFEEEPMEEIMEMFVRRAREMADSYGLDVVGINSNIHQIFRENYKSVAGLRLPAAILTLQGLFKVFLNSSGYAFKDFCIDETNSALFELLILDCLETEKTVFYSAGGDVSRIEKLKALMDYEPAWTRLHPCVYSLDKNCGKCPKCQWLLAHLYVAGKLERFSKIIDVEDFKENYSSYVRKMAVGNIYHSTEAFELLKSKGLVPPEIIRLARVVRRTTELTNVKEVKIQELYKAVRRGANNLVSNILWDILLLEQGKTMKNQSGLEFKYSIDKNVVCIEEKIFTRDEIDKVFFECNKKDGKNELQEQDAKYIRCILACLGVLRDIK